MSSYLIDTNILIDFSNKKQETDLLLATIAKRGQLFVSALTITELCAGWNQQQAAVYLPELYHLVTTKEVTRKIAELAGAFRQEYKRKGIVLPVVDTIIAATALIGNYQLVTRNKKDFPMPEITVYDFAQV